MRTRTSTTKWVKIYRVSRVLCVTVQCPGFTVVDVVLVLLRLKRSDGLVCLLRPWNGVAIPSARGNWLQCRSILFSWLFAIYEPQTCDDEIRGVEDGGGFWVFDSVVVMIDGWKECWLVK